MNILAQNITYYRRKENMTQRELAELLSVSDKTVSRWETGKQIPDALIMPELAKALSVSLDELYSVSRQEAEEEPKEEVPEESSSRGRVTEARNGKLISYKAAVFISIFVCCCATWLMHRTIEGLSWEIKLLIFFTGILILGIATMAFREGFAKQIGAEGDSWECFKWTGSAIVVLDFLACVWIIPYSGYGWFSQNSFLSGDGLGRIFLVWGINILLFLSGLIFYKDLQKKSSPVKKGHLLLPMLMGAWAFAVTACYGAWVMWQPIKELASEWYFREQIVGFTCILAQTINYITLLRMQKGRTPGKYIVRGGAVVVTGMILLSLVWGFGPYTRKTLYREMSKIVMEDNATVRIAAATVGIDFVGEGNYTYFELQQGEHVGQLFQILQEIEIRKEDPEKKVETGEPSALEEQYLILFETYSGDYSWSVKIPDADHLFYRGETYEITNEVDWKEISRLAISEYEGINKELYEELIK